MFSLTALSDRAARQVVLFAQAMLVGITICVALALM